MVGFIFGGNTGQTAGSLADARARMAQAMLEQGMDSSPIRSPLQGAARLAQALVGGLQMRQMYGAQQAENAKLMSAFTGQPYTPPAQSGGILSNLFGGGASNVATGGTVPMADAGSTPTASAPSGGSGNYQDAIAGIESGGNYDAVGPTNPKMGRALGKYQVMEANVGPWSEEALGYAVTPDQFLKNPQIQDAVFNHKFNQYVQQYGPEGAAQAWFGGPGAVGKTGRKDVLGTSVGGYGQKFMAALGQGGNAQPTQVASLDPSSGVTQALGNPPSTPSQAQIDDAVRFNAQITGGSPTAASIDPNSPQGQTVAAAQPTPSVQPAADAYGSQNPEKVAAIQPQTVQGTEVGDSSLNAQSPIVRAMMGLSGPDTASLGGAYPAPPGAVDQTQTGQTGQQKVAQAMNGLPAQSGIMNNPKAAALMEVMMNPYSSEGARQMAGSMLQMQMMPQMEYMTRPDGSVIGINKLTGESRMVTGPMRQPTWGVVSEDASGQKTYGWINPLEGTIKPVGQPSNVPPPNEASSGTGGAPAAPPSPPQQADTGQPQQAPAQPQQKQDTAQNIVIPPVKGEDYLDKLANDPQWGRYVPQARAILRGDLPVPTGNAATKGVDQMIMQLVTRADPGFNASAAAARGAAIKDFTNSDSPTSMGGQILNANAALAHIGEAARASEEFGKTQYSNIPGIAGTPGGSSITNWLQEHGSANNSAYHQALTQYLAIVTPMVEELTKFYSGASGTQASRDAMEEVLNPNSTPEQRSGAFQILIKGLQDKTGEIQRKWHQAMGPGAQDFPIIGPQGQSAIGYVNNLGGQKQSTTINGYKIEQVSP